MKTSSTSNKSKYLYFTFEDYLQDDFFIHSVQHPTAETEHFWKSLEDKSLLIIKEYKTAKAYIESLSTKVHALSNEETNLLWSDISSRRSKIEYQQRKTKRIGLILLTIVASVTLLVTSTFLNRQNDNKTLLSDDIFASLSNIETGNDSKLIIDGEETLILEGKESKVIHKKETVEINETTQRKLYEHNDESDLKLNHLVTPYGKRTMVTLEDGTTIRVNSNTKIAYPSKFSGNKREIYVEGEILLNVAKDKEHPFVVKTRQMDIVVLGTSFNVSAYPNDSLQSVILLNGTVKIISNKENMDRVLNPNQMLSLSDTGYQLTTVDPEKYISWTSGTIICKNEPLKSIVQRLSKYYGKNINLKDTMKEIKCSGKLDMKDDFEVILKGLTNIIPEMKIEKKDENHYSLYN